MKNNTQKVKQYLEFALRATPNDFALTEIRAIIKSALSKIEHIEKKRVRRGAEQEDQSKKWWDTVVAGVVNTVPEIHTAEISVNPLAALNEINKMIAQEEQKLEDLANSKQKKSQGDDMLLGD